MSSREFDIAIAGGGLAGLSLAIQAAAAGRQVVLFEKKSYPFHRVCGEYISLESEPFLKRHGVDIQALGLPVINRLRVTDQYEGDSTVNLPLGGFGISRFMLDNLLADLANAAGVRVYQETIVDDIALTRAGFKIKAKQEEFTARVAVAASGKRSNLDLRWQRPFVTRRPGPLDNFVGIKYHVRYDQPEDLISLHLFPGGYCGISRIEEGECCLCYLTTAANLRAAGNSVEEMERTILGKNPHLKHILDKAERLYEKPVIISQISFKKKSLVENGVLMTGDAAGLISPLCGNGMSMAMHSSVLAFRQIENFLDGGSTLGEMTGAYQAAWKREFSGRLMAGRIFQRLFLHGGVSSRLLHYGLRSPWLSGMLIRATHGSSF